MARPAPGPNKTVRAFRSMAKDYYLESFERFPVWGSGVGLAKLRPLLGKASPEVYASQARFTRRTLARLENMPIHDFEGNDWLDRLQLRSHLRQELLSLEAQKTWQINPQRALDTVGEALFGLIVRHADDIRPVAPALVSRLRAIPRYLDEASDCVETPVPLWTKLAGETAAGLDSLLDSLVSPISETTDHPKKEVARWSKEAKRAIKKYVARAERAKPGPEGSFALGEARFESVLRDRTGLNLSAREAIAAAEALAARLNAELKAEARRFHPRRSAAEILDAASLDWKPEGRDLLSAYRKATREMKAHFKNSHSMTFPRGEQLIVMPVPEFMKHQFPTAAYSAPGALDSDQTGIFWVNDQSKDCEGAEAKRKETAQHFGLELTSAHEAYPGHHLQFATQNQHESFVRRFADHAIYYEGWTLWCEQMTVDLKAAKNPYLKLQQLRDALWRANRIVIDCGLQTGSMTYLQAVKRLQREVGFTFNRARGDVNWYTASPTVPMSYLLGKMELLRLKRQRVDRGGWTLKRFNDWVLSFGAIPWSWIEASGL